MLLKPALLNLSNSQLSISSISPRLVQFIDKHNIHYFYEGGWKSVIMGIVDDTHLLYSLCEITDEPESPAKFMEAVQSLFTKLKSDYADLNFNEAQSIITGYLMAKGYDCYVEVSTNDKSRIIDILVSDGRVYGFSLEENKYE